MFQPYQRRDGQFQQIIHIYLEVIRSIWNFDFE
ncbi:hypothetical protein KV564_09500 [Paenibacillus chitinolyticus]|nr:hypothetical protein [Paenibacillus chitinolyticus]